MIGALKGLFQHHKQVFAVDLQTGPIRSRPNDNDDDENLRPNENDDNFLSIWKCF